jgi:flagellar motor component MotA
MNLEKEINMDIYTELDRMDYFLGIAQKVEKEGLLSLEGIIQDMEKRENFDAFDLTYMGLRLVVEGWDYQDIETIFDNYCKQNIDELAFRIITQGCLSIQRRAGCIRLILYYAALLPEAR